MSIEERFRGVSRPIRRLGPVVGVDAWWWPLFAVFYRRRSELWGPV